MRNASPAETRNVSPTDMQIARITRRCSGFTHRVPCSAVKTQCVALEIGGQGVFGETQLADSLQAV